MYKSFLPALVGLLAASSLVSASASEAHAARPMHYSTVSLGLALGDPTAVDLKFWNTEDSGFDLGLGLEDFDDTFGVYGEYEFGLVAFWLGDDARGTFYVGIGGAVSFHQRHKADNDDVQVEAIVPIGLNFRFRAPLELFVEGRPGVRLTHNERFGIGGQIGLRYVF